MNELKFQRALIKELKAMNGHGWKMAHKMLAGVPDLCLIHPRIGSMYIECKVAKQYFKSGVQIKTTKLQQVTLDRIQKAGGVSGIFLLVEENPQLIYPTANIYQERFIKDDKNHIIRKRGEPWQILTLMNSVKMQLEKAKTSGP